MFSATKFVVAGVVVALFGGFLLTGVLTQQPSWVGLPGVGASASATAQAEPTAAVTVEPEPTTGVEADAPTTTPGFLPGVDLVTEEVAPGVYRVLGDGEHDLRTNVWEVAVRPNGEVWVEKHRVAGYGGQGVDPGDPRIRSERWHRLGDPESYRGTSDGGWHRGDTPGTCGPMGPDGATWLDEESAFWCDYLPDDMQSERMIVRVAPDGTPQGFSPEDMGLGEGVGQAASAISGQFFAYADDGTVWTALHRDDGGFAGLAAYDGEQWRAIESEPLPGDRYYQQIAVAPDGTVWAAWDMGLEGPTGVSWDGVAWTTFGPIAGAGPNISFAPDGGVRFGALTFMEGSSLRQLEIPASASNDDPRIGSYSHASDGSVWVTVIDMRTPKELGCQRNPNVCKGVTDGLYVITPEAVAVAE